MFIQWLALLLATTCFWVGGSAEGIADVFLNITRLLLLSGNGGTDNDGLMVSGLSIMDAAPSAIVSQGPNVHPNTTGSRSAYGSVELLGTISQLEIDLSRAGSVDGGSFTLSVVPEPRSLAVSGIITACGIARQRDARRRARVSP